MSVSHAAALRRGIVLERLTVAWMAIEAVVAIAAGLLAKSVLLTAFGLDSVVELLSAIVVLRRLHGSTGEALATRISAVLLTLLCAYVVLFSLAGLALRVVPDTSVLGVAITLLAVVLMPLLAVLKRRVNRVLESPSLRADIAESITCAFMAAAALAGLLVSSVTGWWWVQYIAALGLLVWLVPETLEAWRGGE